MGSSLRDLNSRQLERLKNELAEVIIANFCYPSFLDYRLNALRTRPVERRKRREVWAYVNKVQLNALGAAEASSMEFRRFVERIFLRYIELNRGLIEGTTPRQFTAMRARVPQLAMQVARSLIEYLALGEASGFGRTRPVESWATQAQVGSEPTWEQIEKSTQVLQTTLVYLRTPHETGPTPALNGAAAGAGNGHMPVQPPAQEEPGGQRPLLGLNRSRTASRPIDGLLSLPSLSPKTGPELVVQPAQPALDQPAATPPEFSLNQPAPSPQGASASSSTPSGLLDQALPPSDAWQALLWLGTNEQTHASVNAAKAASLPEPETEAASPEPDLLELPESFEVPPVLELPPDLAALYGDYLRDAQAGVLGAASAELDTATPGVLREAPAASSTAGEQDEEIDSLFDVLARHIAVEESTQPVSASEEQHAEKTSLAVSNSILPSEQSPLAAQSAGASSPPSRSLAEELTPRIRVSHPRSSAAYPSTDRPTSNPTVPDNSPSASLPAPPARGSSGGGLPPSPPANVVEGDVMIFAQLQHQVTTWVKMAAVSHQIEITGRDALELVGELRRMAALDEAELQVIESLVMLCQRVTTSKQAAMNDYKQAMMLYLLHHRSRLAL